MFVAQTLPAGPAWVTYQAIPAIVWCRHSTLLVMRGDGDFGTRFAMGAPQAPLLPAPLRRAGRTMAMRSCFLSASLVLVAARGLLRVGFLAPNDAERPLRWASGLVRIGMRLWRKNRIGRRV